jgi:Fe-S cluster assembly protein SufD
MSKAFSFEQHLPTRQNERWKYADLDYLKQQTFTEATHDTVNDLEDVINHYRLQLGDSTLMVFVNGYYMPSYSDRVKLPHQVIACSLDEAMIQHADLMPADQMSLDDYPFAKLNKSVGTNGFFLYVPANIKIAAPLHFLSIVTDTHEFVAHSQRIVILGDESNLSMIEEYASLAEQSYFMNIVNHLYVGKKARLTYCKIQEEGKCATHIAATFVTQNQDSHTDFKHFSCGSLFARDDLVVSLNEKGANCTTRGFYSLQQDNQYIDHHVDIRHRAPHSTSEMLYKGILKNKSRSVFNGRLYVEKDAQKITAYQANHNLLLSQTAEVYSKPELEIYADDVKCKHGATTGQLDQDAIFYMQSRGIARDEAVAILLQGFADEVMHDISHPGIKKRVMEMVMQ